MGAASKARRGLVLGALALASLAPAPALAEAEGKPRLLDGGSLEIEGRRFRLSGIAAPGLDQVCQRAGRDYACGKVARAVLWDLIGGREVTCQPVGAAGAADDEAIAATCKAGDADLAEGMVAAGWALADRAAAPSYRALEDEARQARRGLWTGEFDRPLALGEQAE
jgi:endonuclease YncB( thermonuclease family)